VNPKRGYVEMFFRHRWLAVPLVLVPLVALAVGVVQPRHFVSTTNIWSDAPIPNGSTIEQTNPTGTSPSAAQQALLSELLTTRQFVITVAEHTPLAHFVRTQPRQQVDEALGAMSKGISSTTPGPQVLSVTVKDTSPTMAVAVAHAVGTQLVAEEVATLKSRDQAVMSYEQQQMDALLRGLSNAQGPSAVLAQQYTNAEQQYDQAQADFASVGNTTVLGIIDPAGPAQRQGRIKLLLLAGLGGVLAGLAVVTALLALLMARDKTIWGPADLQSEHGLAVVGAVERVGDTERDTASVGVGA